MRTEEGRGRHGSAARWESEKGVGKYCRRRAKSILYHYINAVLVLRLADASHRMDVERQKRCTAVPGLYSHMHTNLRSTFYVSVGGTSVQRHRRTAPGLAIIF